MARRGLHAAFLAFLLVLMPAPLRADEDEDALLRDLGAGHQGLDRIAVMIERGFESSPAALEGVSIRRVWRALEGPTTEANFEARRRFLLALMGKPRVLDLLSVEKEAFVESWVRHKSLNSGRAAHAWVDGWLDRMVFRPVRRNEETGGKTGGVVERPRRSKMVLVLLGLGLVGLLAFLILRAVPPRRVVDEELIRSAEDESRREGAFMPPPLRGPPSPSERSAPPSAGRASRSAPRRRAQEGAELGGDDRNRIIQAKVHLRNNEGVEAVKLLQEVEKGGGRGHPDVQVLLVQAFARAGHGEIARRRFLALDGALLDKAARYELGCAFADGGDPERARPLLQAVCSEDIAYRDAHERLAALDGSSDATRPASRPGGEEEGERGEASLAPLEGEKPAATALRLARALVPERYAELSLIGRGGMGFVFRALDQDLLRPVAIKMLSPLVAENERVVKRFYNETRAIANLDHPNVISVFDVVRARLPFYVMEFLEGQSLAAHLLDRGAMASFRILPIARQIASALAHAHERRIIHRDVKPANVILLPGDELRLVDFGVARMQDGGRMTRSGEVLGSPMYMAPEQLLGRKVDARIDLYALGLVLFELVTGTFPFDPKNFFERTLREAPLLREVDPSVPEELEELVKDLLSMDPDLRVATATTVLERIDGMMGPGDAAGQR